jgi:hypothetical protein
VSKLRVLKIPERSLSLSDHVSIGLALPFGDRLPYLAIEDRNRSSTRPIAGKNAET